MNLEPLPVVQSPPAKWWEMVRTGMLAKVTFGVTLLFAAWLWINLVVTSEVAPQLQAQSAPAQDAAPGVAPANLPNETPGELIAASRQPAQATLVPTAAGRDARIAPSKVTHTVIAVLDERLLAELQAGDEVELRSPDGKTIIGYARVTRVTPSAEHTNPADSPGPRALQVVVQVTPDVRLQDQQKVYIQAKRDSSKQL